MGQFDDGVSLEVDLVQGVADGCVVHVTFAHGFDPGFVLLLVAEVEEDDAVAEFEEELDGVDVCLDEPIEVRPEFCVWNSSEGAAEVVEVVLDFVFVIVQIEIDAVGLCYGDDFLEQIGLGVQLLFCLLASCRADRGAEGCASECRQAGDDLFGVFEDGLMLVAVPHGAAEGGAQDGKVVFFGKGSDSLDSVVGTQGRVHEFDAVHAGILHVGEDCVKHGCDVELGLGGGVDPRVSADDDSVGGIVFGEGGWGVERADAGCQGGASGPAQEVSSRRYRGGVSCHWERPRQFDWLRGALAAS